MSKLNAEIESVKQENAQEVALNMDVLTDIVDAELDNVAAGGFDQYSGYHGANIVE